MTRTSILLTLAFAVGCGFIPQELPYTDPQVQELLRATEAASTYRFGFTPVSPDSRISLEKSSGAYDRMLHIEGRTSRTISFRNQGDSFTWIGEQEIYRGPKKYTTVDGTYFESLSITYKVEHGMGNKLDQLQVNYHGVDQQLRRPKKLTLQTITPILKEWGYDVDQIGANGSQPGRSDSNSAPSTSGPPR